MKSSFISVTPMVMVQLKRKTSPQISRRRKILSIVIPAAESSKSIPLTCLFSRNVKAGKTKTWSFFFFIVISYNFCNGRLVPCPVLDKGDNFTDEIRSPTMNIINLLVTYLQYATINKDHVAFIGRYIE